MDGLNLVCQPATNSETIRDTTLADTVVMDEVAVRSLASSAASHGLPAASHGLPVASHGPGISPHTLQSFAALSPDAAAAEQLAPGVSVIVPVFNGQQTIGELVERIDRVLGPAGMAYEILLINDGSHDRSWPQIAELAVANPRVRGLNLMRNFGQHNALLCGLRHARFEVTVTLDDDLQHPPEEIPRLLAKLAEGHDVVYGTPRTRPHHWWRNWTSVIAKRGMAKLLGNSNIGMISAFRAFRTRLRFAMHDFRSPRLSLDMLLSWGTSRFANADVLHLPRRSGQSNYNFLKLVDLTLITLTSYSTTPLRLVSLVGFAATGFGMLAMTYVCIRWFHEGSVPGFPFLASVMCLFGGAQMFCLGIMGEYLARMYNRSQDRPTYILAEDTAQNTGCADGPRVFRVDEPAPTSLPKAPRLANSGDAPRRGRVPQQVCD